MRLDLARKLKEEISSHRARDGQAAVGNGSSLPMNAVHLHLAINHLPIGGALLSVPLVVLALAFRNERGFLIAATLALTLTGAGALAAMQTGEPAEDAIEHLPGVAESLIDAHEERAEIATYLAGRSNPSV